jgi:hypothetical protein
MHSKARESNGEKGRVRESKEEKGGAMEINEIETDSKG